MLSKESRNLKSFPSNDNTGKLQIRPWTSTGTAKKEGQTVTMPQAGMEAESVGIADIAHHSQLLLKSSLETKR